MSFSSSKLDPFAVVINKCEDFPYKNFKLRCIKKDVAIIDIEGRRLKFCFEIGAGYVKLLPKSDEKISFLKFIGIELTPEELLHVLLDSK